jgi:hypothetical protein
MAASKRKQPKPVPPMKVLPSCGRRWTSSKRAIENSRRQPPNPSRRLKAMSAFRPEADKPWCSQSFAN